MEAKLVGDLSSVHGILARSSQHSMLHFRSGSEVACFFFLFFGSLKIGCTYGKILLVGKDQENGVPQLILVEHALELLAGLDDTVTIVAVDDEDDALGVLEIMPPQRTNLILTSSES